MQQQVADLIEFPDGRRFLRQGECDGCARPGVEAAQCCTFLMLPLARKLTVDERYWVGLHPGVSIVGDQVRIDVPCSALEDGRCVLFGTSGRPSLCERYPEQPDQLLPGCAYALEEF